MSEKNNATCNICGNGYHVCYSCKDSIQLHPWKMYCCSVDCYKTLQVVRGFSTGVYTKDEFKSRLKKLDLSNLDNYREHIKALIKDALNEEVAFEAVEKAEELVKSPEMTMPIEEMVVEDVKNIEKPVYSRKRNYKVEAK